jgi:Terminase large subunit, T4likevirus-type, N-terminal
MPVIELRYTRPWLYPQQEQAIFCPERYAVVEASTKSGKTVACLIWLVEAAMAGLAGQNFWWVAPIFAQARIAFRRMKQGLPKEVYTANESELTITLANGSLVWFKSADNPDSLYGEDVFAVVMDEATRSKEEAWHAVRSTLTATRGPIRIIGNVKGRKNWAYRLARMAESGEANMHFAKITAHDAVSAGILDADEIRSAKRDLPDAVFRELYLAEPSDDEGNPFGLQTIRACIRPLSSGHVETWGIDLAKSVDWTVAIGLDADKITAAFARWQGPWEETILKLRIMASQAPALVDSTGVGDPVLEALQRGGGLFAGFKFTQPSKQQLMEGLAVAIQRGEVGYPDGPIVNELEAFEYEYTRTGVRYSAPEGMHDDCVCALALAFQHSKSARADPVWWR